MAALWQGRIRLELWIGRFRITFCLFFKASLGADLFIWKLVFICIWMNANFHMKRWAPGLALKKRPKVIRKWPIKWIWRNLGAVWLLFLKLRYRPSRKFYCCALKRMYILTIRNVRVRDGKGIGYARTKWLVDIWESFAPAEIVFAICLTWELRVVSFRTKRRETSRFANGQFANAFVRFANVR